MLKTPIREFIYLFRIQQVKSQLHRGLFQITIGCVVVLLILGILESIFYFTIPVRSILVEFVLFLFIAFLIYIFLRAYLNTKSIFTNSSNWVMAHRYKNRDPQIGDRLLNALQLEESLNEMETGRDLAEYAIRNIDSKLHTIPASSLYDPVSNILKKTLMLSISIAFVITLIMYNTLPASFSRLAQPTQEFPVPLPFMLSSLSQNQQVLGGDTLTVSIAGYGELPDSINIHWEEKDNSGTIVVGMENQVYHHTFAGIKRDTRYWAEYESPSWFSSWDLITTIPDTIIVIDRPVIHDLVFTVIPPLYTGEDESQHPGNITDIYLPEGSRIRITGKATKILASASMMLDDAPHNLFIQSDHFTGTILIHNEQTAVISIEDENGVPNLTPPHYRLNIIPD